MDGRMFRGWCVFGCLVAGTIGCNRNTQQGPFGQMPNTNGQTVNMPLPGSNSKSLWGGSSAPTLPVEVAPPVRNKPASADALVASANVRLDAALDEQPAPGTNAGAPDPA